MPRPKKAPKKAQQEVYAKDIQDVYVQRISECQTVLDHLETCPAWQVIKKDCDQQKQIIDDNWQNLAKDDPKLEELRITKLAYMHLSSLVDKYKMDLDSSKKELDKLQNTETKVVKDYDSN